MKKLALLCLMAFWASAQDAIIIKNGDVIKAKVIEVAADFVKYNRYADSSKKQYVISTTDLRGVKYNASVYYTTDSSKIEANDKLFLANGDTLKVAIQDIWGEMIRYKSACINNGVVYAMIKSEILGYQKNGSNRETISSQKGKNASLPSAQPVQNQNSIAKNTSIEISNSYKKEKKENISSWFFVAQLGGFIPFGSFAANNLPVDTTNFPLYEGKNGFAKPSYTLGFEGAYFVNKYLGFGTAFFYTSLPSKIFDTQLAIPPQYTIETKPWKLYVFSPGVYVRIPSDVVSFNFKLCLTAVNGVTDGYYFSNSFNYISVESEKFTAFGIVFGGDIKIDLSEKLVCSIGIDYLNTFEQKIIRLAEQYDYTNNLFIDNVPLYRNISVQGFKMNFGLGFKF